MDRSSTHASRRRHGPSLRQRSDAGRYQQIAFVDGRVRVSGPEVTLNVGGGGTRSGARRRRPPLGGRGGERRVYDVGRGRRAEHALKGSAVLSIQGLHDRHGGFDVRIVLQEGVEFVQHYGTEAGYFQLAALVVGPADDQFRDPAGGLARQWRWSERERVSERRKHGDFALGKFRNRRGR